VDAPVFYLNFRPSVDAEVLRADIRSGELPILTFSSPSAVDHFVDLMDEETQGSCERCIIVAIGQTTAGALREAGLSPDVVPEKPGARAMAAALAQHVGQLERKESPPWLKKEKR
jgi:uroporphyrinogen-III synthase